MENQEAWQKVVEFVTKVTGGKTPQDLKGYLFLIGVQTLGHGPKVFSRDQKQDILHIAVCEILCPLGYYKLSHRDEDGWPHYEVLDKIPHAKLFGQEDLLKQQIIAYFEREQLI